MLWFTITANILILMGMYANGQKWRICFLLSGVGEIIWTVVALWNGQYDLGFICAVFVAMCVWNNHKWKKEGE